MLRPGHLANDSAPDGAAQVSTPAHLHYQNRLFMCLGPCQEDLREECIKLKMRVFDLERQNKTLTELFTQKLHPSPGPLQQHIVQSLAYPRSQKKRSRSGVWLRGRGTGECEELCGDVG
ncbi:hypothetical protein NFI96_003704 [Prochilodus magdalenae]|nr:hypothetical protein NFI96_003704 [Prochilodus magdalenae]